MMKKTVLAAAFAALVLSAAPACAEDGGKLDQILAKQDEILRSLEEIKTELAAVKVRATK